MPKKVLIEEAYQIREKCVLMLENAPQEMSNVTLIQNVLTVTNQLINYLEQVK
jgi:hypothetical protein